MKVIQTTLAAAALLMITSQAGAATNTRDPKVNVDSAACAQKSVASLGDRTTAPSSVVGANGQVNSATGAR